MFASAHDFPKFVKVGAAMEHELRKVGTSGVDLTFAGHLAANPEGECQILNSTRNLYLLVAPCF